MNVVNLLMKLLSFNTENPPGRTEHLLSFVEKLAISAGLKAQRFNVEDGKYNLYITAENEPNVLFVAHADTVPIGKGWNRNPLGEQLNDRIYGRGAVDTKGSLAAMLHVIMTEKRGSMLITRDEEVGLLGAKAFVKEHKDLIPDNVIVGEPTDLGICTSHKGVMTVRLTFKGVSAHAAFPEKGENAIHKAIFSILPLIKREKLSNSTTVQVTEISGGFKANVIPDTAELTLDVRYVEEDRTTIEGRLHEADEVNIPVRLRPFTANKSFVNRIKELTGLKETVLPFYTEAGIFSEATNNVVIIGPGNPEMAHKPDEWIYIDDLHRAVNVYRKIIKEL